MRHPPCLKAIKIRIYRASAGWPSDGGYPQAFKLLTISSRAIGSVRTMYRMINENEKVTLSVARETRFAALNRFGAVLVNSARRHFKRAAIERELSRLDNRMLGDLG